MVSLLNKDFELDSSGVSNVEDSPKYALFTQIDNDFHILEDNSQISSPVLNLTQIASQNIFDSNNHTNEQVFYNKVSQNPDHQTNDFQRKNILEILNSINSETQEDPKRIFEKQKSTTENDDIDWKSRCLFIIFRFHYTKK
ncbi:hypothetical protein AYI68_g414 [Smittium mucronatum]|uniref:Uncharacterized protein n=1 Tax=Smittium mucronatum TaxID=133383 RepID=A0A1R0H893_9FUNG|nr:hypothetical protein AYI68_g414 [Smittium mucronatum]